MKIWSLSQLRENVDYQLELCQSAEGYRYYRLVEASAVSATSGGDAVFVTKTVPHALLTKRSLGAIAREIQLKSGDPYFVDAHGMWLTKAEWEQLVAGRPFSSVEWCTSREPIFAPR